MPAALSSSLPTHRAVVGRLLLRALLPPVIFLITATLILLVEVRYLVHSMQRVDQSDEITSQIDDMQRLFIDMETGLRAYLATGSDELLEPYKDSESQIQGRFEDISRLVSDNQDQRKRIARLRGAYGGWAASAAQMLRERQAKGDLGKALLAERMLTGKRLMDDLRGQVAGMLAAENHLREVSLRQARTTEYVVPGTTALLALTGCAILVVRTRRQIHDIIETHALRATNELLETLVKNAPAGLAMFDRDMRHIRASEIWLRDVGMSGKDIIGKSHYELFPNLPEHVKDAHRRGLAGESVSGDVEWIDSEGIERSSHWVVQPYGVPGGQTGGIILFAEDTTERKRNETALRESEERFRTLVQHASDAFFLHDTEGRLIDVNQQACDSLGYTREELLQMTVFDIEEDFDMATAQNAWRQMMITGPVTWEGHHRRKDGSTFAHEARLSAYQVGDKQFILGLVRDITERRQFELKLRESEATIRTLLDTASQAILAVDANGTIVLANRMVGQMFGYLPGDLVGQQLEMLIPERFRKGHRDYRGQFVRDPFPRLMGTGRELLGLRRDGQEFPIEVSLSSVEIKNGILAVSFVSDITARKLAEQALKHSEQQLRMLAGSLLTAQEDERRNLARELHDDITQQLAFLSIGLGNLSAAMPDGDAASRAAIQDLQKQALRASAEVRRLSHGLHPSVITDFGLSVALEDFCEDFERVHGIAVGFENPFEEIHLADAQATCLYRVAQESMRNAVVHGKATEITVSLSIADQAIQLKVADNGGGFNAKQIQGKAGLGIISMTERVRLAGGHLSLDSTPGQGTEITATLPIMS